MPCTLFMEPDMPTRNVVLTAQQSGLVERLVASGQYQNASEVLREGLRMLERRDRDDAARHEALLAAVALGVADIGAGRYRAFDEPDALQDWVGSLGQAE